MCIRDRYSRVVDWYKKRFTNNNLLRKYHWQDRSSRIQATEMRFLRHMSKYTFQDRSRNPDRVETVYYEYIRIIDGKRAEKMCIRDRSTIDRLLDVKQIPARNCNIIVIFIKHLLIFINRMTPLWRLDYFKCRMNLSYYKIGKISPDPRDKYKFEFRTYWQIL